MTATRDPIDEADRRDAAWLRDMASGHRPRAEQAVRGLVGAYRGALLGWLKRHGALPEVAEDVVQVAFMKAVQSAAQHRGDGTVRAWLYTIVRHCWMDELRKKHPETLLDDDGWGWINDTHAAPVPPPALGTPDDCVADGFARYASVHPERAEVIRRQVLDHWTVKDIAAYLRRTETATYEYLSQCRKKLRPFIEPCLALATQAS